MNDSQTAHSLAALRRCARTLRDDARELAELLDGVSERLSSPQAAVEATGPADAARTLAGAHAALGHAAVALPWLRTEVLLLAAALPQLVCGLEAPLPLEHPWLPLVGRSPLRLDSDLFDAQFQ